MLDFLNSGPLNLTYAGILLVSFLFAMLALVGAEVGELFDFDVDAGDGGFDFINISPFAIATFGTTFGLTGLITRLWLSMEAVPSILWSAGISLAIGGLAQVFFVYVLSTSTSSHYSLARDAAGREAEVSVTIPSDGIGTISFYNVSGRVNLGARSATGEAIGAGTLVVIERLVGRVAVVRPVETPE